jgi:tetratricopeptide (TPR) repeat protein
VHPYFTFSLPSWVRFKQIYWLILILAGLACRFGTAPANPSPDLSPTPPAQPSPSPHSIPPSATPPSATPPSVTPSLAPSPTAAATLPPDPICVPPGSAQTALTPGEFRALGDKILSFLNAGASPDELKSALDDLGIASQPTALLSGDLDGDGKTDLAVSVFDPTSSSFPPASALLVYLCEPGAYRQVFDDYRPLSSHLWYFMDMNANGGGELVVSWAQCGVHTCFEDVQILVWDGAALVNRLEGSSSELAFPFIQMVDGDQDGVYDLEINATGPGSVGAGPPRNSLNRWSYQAGSDRWQFAGQDLLPSNFRIHVLNDADAAARAGSFQQALADYLRVILDDSLQDWVDPVRERSDLQAYARFRLVVLYWRMDQPESAEQAYQEMTQSIPANAAQFAFAEMADAFLRAARSGGLEPGCAAVEAYASAHSDQVLAPLNSFGYAAPGITAADLCP